MDSNKRRTIDIPFGHDQSLLLQLIFSYLSIPDIISVARTWNEALRCDSLAAWKLSLIADQFQELYRDRWNVRVKDWFARKFVKHLPRIPLDRLRTNDTDTQLQMCELIRTHSFAIITFSDHDVDLMRKASKMAMDFFCTTPVEEKKRTTNLFDEVGNNKGLAGYSSPTLAKEVFRIRRDTDNPSYIWPQMPNFQSTFTQAFWMFDDIVRLCTKILLASVGVTFEEVMTEDPPDKFGSSPFDLFYYNNLPNATKVINCSEHIDPGYLTVVPCAEVPGLAIVDQESFEWIQVEKYLQPRKEGVIFPGGVVQRLSDFAILAGIHRVDKHPSLPRLSLVHELRPKAGAES